MRRIVEAPARTAFDVFARNTDGYGHVFALTGARHVALKRVSKGMLAAVRGAGKRAAVEYSMDSGLFNVSNEQPRAKLAALMEDLAATCAQFDVQVIDMCGLELAADTELEIAPMLRNCPGLTSLRLCRDGLRDVRAMDAALPGCTGLTRLDLSGNRLEVFEDTFTGLAQCTTLRELNLHDCTLVTDGQFRVLSNALQHLPALVDLDLGRNGHGDDADSAEALLEGCTGLTRLGLGDCYMQNRALEGYCRALPRLGALAHLDLSRNFMGSTGFDFLEAALGRCTSLETLDVHSCGINPDPDATHAFAFTDALPGLERLRELDLSRNRLGRELWTALVEVLPRCRALQLLNVEGCFALQELNLLPQLVPALPACHALRELNLRENRALPAADARRLREAWAQVPAREAERLRLPLVVAR